MHNPASPTARARPPVLLMTGLSILAGLAVIAGAIAALMVLVADGDSGRFGWTTVVISMGCLLAGVVVGAILWAITDLIRRQSRLSLLRASARKTIAQREAQPLELLPAGYDDEPASEPVVPTLMAQETGEGDQRLLRQVLAQLKDLNENLLLSPEQRDAKRCFRQTRLRRRLDEEVRAALDEGNFSRAEALLEDFAERVPEDPVCEDLRRRLTEAQEAAKRRDVESYSRQVSDLMAISSFEKAEETARELRQRYPQEPEADALMQRVLREGKMFRAERRERLFREVERRAEARQWRAALQAARRFVEAFPSSVDADAVRAMIPTMEDNARIEEVREIRDFIRDLIQRRRYAEAVEAAEDIIRRFPDTRAATELGRQLHRLRELARSPSGSRPSR